MITPDQVSKVLDEQREDLFKEMDFYIENRLGPAILESNGIGPFEVKVGLQRLTNCFSGFANRQTIELYQERMLKQGWVCVITDGAAGIVIVRLRDVKEVNKE